MKLLAIDTATEACSAAVLDGEMLVERYQLAPRAHNRLILLMIEEALAECGLSKQQLDAVAFGCGPGSFTGLRIAAGVAQGLALGLDLPVLPISTLAALALDALAITPVPAPCVFACIDARMDEVYWGVYEALSDGEMRLVGTELVSAPEQVPVSTDLTGVGAGSGWAAYADELSGRVGARLRAVLPDRYPRAGAIARLGAAGLRRGGGVDPAQAQPVYLRDNVARKPGSTA